MTRSRRPTWWGPAVISGLVVVGFFGLTIALLTRAIPAGSEQVVTMLVGGLTTAFANVVGYWTGSSASQHPPAEHQEGQHE